MDHHAASNWLLGTTIGNFGASIDTMGEVACRVVLLSCPLQVLPYGVVEGAAAIGELFLVCTGI